MVWPSVRVPASSQGNCQTRSKARKQIVCGLFVLDIFPIFKYSFFMKAYNGLNQPMMCKNENFRNHHIISIKPG